MATEPVTLGRAREYGRLDDEISPAIENGPQCAATETALPHTQAVGRGRNYGRLQESPREVHHANGAEDKSQESKPKGNAVRPDCADGNGVATVAPAAGSVEEVADDTAPQTPVATTSLAIYLTFAVFGAGSSWLMVNAAYLELPIYQDEFGLVTSNRMAIGYDLGTLALPCFAIVRELLRSKLKGVNYRMVIPALGGVQLATLLWCAAGVSSLNELILVNFLGGACGYLSGIIHQAYLLMRYHNTYTAAFWAGDAAGGVLAALLAIMQQPQLDASERRFSPLVFYMLLTPLVPVSIGTFFYIESRGLGALPHDTFAKAISGAAGEGDEEDETDEEDEIEDGEVEDGAGPEGAARTESVRCSEVELTVASAASASNECGAASAAVSPTVALSSPTSPTRQTSSASVASRRKATQAMKNLLRAAWRSLPTGAKRRPGKTSILVLIVFWSQFANWGIVDSISPYACAKASPDDLGDACVFQTSFGTILGGLLGINLAAMYQNLSMKSLLWPFVLYTAPFPVICLAAAYGGRWADPWASEGDSGIAGTYMALLVAAMRTFGPLVATQVAMLVQIEYDAQEFESMNFFLTSIGTASNFVGIVLATLLLEDADER